MESRRLHLVEDQAVTSRSRSSKPLSWLLDLDICVQVIITGLY